MMSSISILQKMYAEDSRRFVRCIEFILIKYRIKSVRFHLCENQYSVCSTIAGTLVTDGSIKKEYDSISDWYNDVMKTDYDATTTSYFANITISKKVNLEFVLAKMATVEDIQEFTDHKYRSYMLYKQINATLRGLNHIRAWNSYSVYRVAWNNAEYNVRINSTSTIGDTDTSNAMLAQFIQGTSTDLYHITSTSRILIPNIVPGIRSQRRIRKSSIKSAAPVALPATAEESVEEAVAEHATEESVAEESVEEPQRQYVSVDMGILVQHINASGAFVHIDAHNALKSSFEIAMQEINVLKEHIKNLQAHVDAQGRYLSMFNEYTMKATQQPQSQQYYIHQPQTQYAQPYIVMPQNYANQ